LRGVRPGVGRPGKPNWTQKDTQKLISDHSARTQPPSAIRRKPWLLVSFFISMNAIPSIFELPESVRSTLPDNVKHWMTGVEARVDGMTLPKIEKEAKKLAGPTEDWKKIYRLGRRVFYGRLQAIWDIAYPDSGLEVGIDIICRPFWTDVPGAVIDDILHGEEPSNSDVLEEAGILDNLGQPKKDPSDDSSDHEEAAAR
jgi:hypothetical protein